jgi:glycosyltransferase involved in cell wall biosynthesis
MRIGVYVGNQRPEVGGGYTYVADLLDAFLNKAAASDHHYVILCTPDAAMAIHGRLYAPNISLAPVALPSRIGIGLIGFRSFSPLFRWLWRRPDAVERIARRHGIQMIWFVGVDAQAPPDIPYIATLWDLQHRRQPFFPEVSARGVWDKREQFYGHFLGRAAYCLTGTEAGKKEIVHFYQLEESRVRVLPLPTPAFALNPPPSGISVQDELGLDQEYILYPAQFWPHKNHINLILALKWLKSIHGWPLMLVLTGSDQGNLAHVRQVAEQAGVASQIRFPGFVSREQLTALYRNATALVFVSYFGPDNIPPLEAFALGCPVIASSVEGASEQYGEAVLSVDPSDPEAIGEAIWRLRSDSGLRQALISAGAARARRWTAHDYVDGLFKLFDEFAAIRRNWP